MKDNTLFKVSGMVLLAIVVSLVVFALIHALQVSDLAPTLVTVSWNG